VKYYTQPNLYSFLRKQILYEAPYNAYLWYVAPYAFAARHAITGLFAAGVLGGVLLSPAFVAVRVIFVPVMVVYFAIAVWSSIQQAIRYREPRHIVFLPIAFFLYHFLHGVGLLVGLLRLLTRTAPVQKLAEPWPGAGRLRAWPLTQRITV
jgi:hypothetical protein